MKEREIQIKTANERKERVRKKERKVDRKKERVKENNIKKGQSKTENDRG